MIRTFFTHVRQQWMGALALFLVLTGGSAYAANTVFSSDIVDGEVKTPDLAGSAVTDTKLAGGSVLTGKLKNDAVTSSKVLNETLLGADVKDNSLKGVDIDESTLSSIGGGGPAGGDLTGTYPNPEIRSNAVNSAKVADDSLTGADVQFDSLTGSNINESTLSQVPDAVVGELGGLGRFTGNGACNPNTNAYVDCAITTMYLPTATSVLLIGHVTAGADGADPWTGNCKLVTNSGDVPATGQFFYGSGDVEEAGALVGITGTLGVGWHDFAVDCDQNNGIKYAGVGIASIAISPY